MTVVEDPIAKAIARTLLPPRTTSRRVPLQDAYLVAVLLLLQTVLAVGMPGGDGRTPDLLGWTLLTAMPLVLLFRRQAAWPASAAVLALDVPYHLLDYAHTAAVPAGVAALFSLAVTGPLLRTFLTLGTALGATTVLVLGLGRAHVVPGMLRDAGWLVAVVLIGEAVRIHRDYVTAIVERAERAERTREEEAARRVAEERLRIARDLHDLLAHSITLIGVQTSVAAHVLVADPGRLDRDAVVEALDGIADTCRDARGELRTTLEVLRAGDPATADVLDQGPLPGLAGLPDLVRAAEGAGAHVKLDVRPGPQDAPHDGAPPSAVGAAAYRIVQEALTNAVRHAGRGVRLRVVLERTPDDGALRVVVRDDGGPPGAPTAPETDRPGTGPGTGLGIVGMRERARSVGGTLAAGPSSDGDGFTVTAVLPLTEGSRNR